MKKLPTMRSVLVALSPNSEAKAIALKKYGRSIDAAIEPDAMAQALTAAEDFLEGIRGSVAEKSRAQLKTLRRKFEETIR